MVEGILSLIWQVVWIVVVPLLVVGLFVLLPIAVAKNVGGIAERFAVLPGVDPGGGRLTGLVMVAYPLLLVGLVGVAWTVASDGFNNGDSPPAIDSEVDDDAPRPEHGPDSSDESGDTTETDDHSADDPPDDPESGEDETVSGERTDMRIQVYEIEQDWHNILDEGEMTLYGPTGTPLETQNITKYGEEDFPSPTNWFRNLISEQNYTASITGLDRWPDVNVTFDPGEYERRVKNVTVGYELNPVDSHRSVFLENFTELEDRARFIRGGYAAFAENGDAIEKTTNAEADNTDGYQQRWVSATFTDGKTDQTFEYGSDGWTEVHDPHDNLHEPFPALKYRHPKTRASLHDIDDAQRKYMGRKTLDGTSVEKYLSDEPLEDRIPQINTANEALYNRTVDVYYYEVWHPSFPEAWIYVDVDTKHLVRAEYADRRIADDQPIWVTIDYWDHGEVESVEEYNAEDLAE